MTANSAEPARALPSPAGIPTLLRAPIGSPLALQGLDIALFGVPFDGGTYGRIGSRLGPASVRDASRLVRPINLHSGTAPFEICTVADIGDVAINPMNFEANIAAMQSFAASLAAAGVAPIAVGGDHTVPLPVLRGLAPKEPLGLVHFDAHSDTSDEVHGSRINYATPFRRAVEEGLIDPKRTVQIGIRGQVRTADALDWPRSVGMRVFDMDTFEDMGRAAVIDETRRIIGSKPAYVTFDLDALDSVHAPGTGSPEPGGLTTRDALVIIRKLDGLDIVGADFCEVNPSFDPSGVTAINSAHLIYELLCIVATSVVARKARPS